MQMRGRIFDVVVLVLAGPAFRGKHATTVDTYKVPIRKLTPSFRIRVLLLVDPEMPFGVFGHPVLVDKVIRLLRGRPVLAPCIPLVEHKASAVDEFLGMLEPASIEFHCHDLSLLFGRRCRGSFCVRTNAGLRDARLPASHDSAHSMQRIDARHFSEPEGAKSVNTRLGIKPYGAHR
jgi:hypothetical protein